MQSAWGQVLPALRDALRGQFDIEREVGRGGMAAVFLGYERALNRRVAVKVMSPALMMSPDLIQRFRHEAQVLAALEHPNIARIYTFGEKPFHHLVMQFVGGPTLQHVLESAGPLPVQVVQALLHQIGEALAFAHGKGVVHRDLKPLNLMLDEQGRALVMDFGIAKVVGEAGQTATGVQIGTAGYMSPEQVLTQPVGPASDQYSLGVVAFQLLTGRLPFEGPTGQVMLAQVQTKPEAVTKYRRDCPPAVAAAVGRMLAKGPTERFTDITAAVKALGGFPVVPGDSISRYLEAAATGKPFSGQLGGRPVPDRKRNSRLLVGLAAVAVVVGAALTWAFAGGGGGGEPPPPPPPQHPPFLAAEVDDSVSSVEIRKPRYPAGLQQAGVAGSVDVQYVVAIEGKAEPESFRILRSTDRAFNDPAREAILGSTFKPARIKGVPVRQLVAQRVSFELAKAELTRRIVAPANIRLLRGDRWTPNGRVYSGAEEDKTAPITWSLERGTALRPIGRSGFLAIEVGRAAVRADAPGARAVQIEVTVDRPEVASVALQTPDSLIVGGDSWRLAARAIGANGQVISDPEIDWTVSPAGRASIANGQLRALSPGDFSVTAHSGAKTGTATIRAVAEQGLVPPPPPPPPPPSSAPPRRTDAAAAEQITALNVDLVAEMNRRSTVALRDRYHGGRDGWRDNLMALVEKDLVHAELVVDDRDAGLELADASANGVIVLRVKYRSPTGGRAPRDGRLQFKIVYSRLGTTWSIRSLVLLQPPPT